jgi:hypothetical protein
VRSAFAHDALLDMAVDADLAAPGGAITSALCGTFAHPPPCPLAPHHTRSTRRDDGVAVRVLFAVEPAREAEVRARIDGALRAGLGEAPDGTRTRWVLRGSTPGTVVEEEREHAGRLVAN